jgi:hypothetical protein
MNLELWKGVQAHRKLVSNASDAGPKGTKKGRRFGDFNLSPSNLEPVRPKGICCDQRSRGILHEDASTLNNLISVLFSVKYCGPHSVELRPFKERVPGVK